MSSSRSEAGSSEKSETPTLGRTSLKLASVTLQGVVGGVANGVGASSPGSGTEEATQQPEMQERGSVSLFAAKGLEGGGEGEGLMDLSMKDRDD